MSGLRIPACGASDIRNYERQRDEASNAATHMDLQLSSSSDRTRLTMRFAEREEILRASTNISVCERLRAATDHCAQFGVEMQSDCASQAIHNDPIDTWWRKSNSMEPR
jgi:hypothetical protein